MVNRRIWLNLGLAILAPVVFFSLLEATLALAGVLPLALTEDPYVGFSSMQPLYVEKAGAGGVKEMITNPAKVKNFNSQSFPRKKPPGAYRIFSLGGSTAYGHPWRDPVSFSGWLRELLPAADTGRKWEVINAGGISYASYREAKLVEELCEYQPDLFIIYSGHNEFLEERTYRKAAALPGPLRDLGAWLDRTRTYTLMRKSLRRIRAGDEEKPTRMAGEVDDILGKTIGPTSYSRNDTLRRDVLDHYRASLSRIANLAHAVGAQVLFITTPGNERDCSPFKSEPTPGLDPAGQSRVRDWMGRATQFEAEGKVQAAYAVLDSAAALDHRDASVLYRAGRAAFQAQRFPEAKRLFLKALDEDICPLRASTSMRSVVLETARATGSESLDFTDSLERKTKERAGHDLLGEPEFVDHVHLSVEDYRFLALAILGKLSGMGVLRPLPEFGEQAVHTVSDRIMSGMGSKEKGEGLHNLAKVINWAGKHEDAARIAERALAMDSTGLEAIWSSLFVGAARERQGRGAEAIPHYRRAVALDLSNPMSHAYLAAALGREGNLVEASVQYAEVLGLDPGDAGSRVEFAVILMRLGRASEAVDHLTLAVRQVSGNADWQYLLGEALLAAGRPAEAEARFQECLRQDPRTGRGFLGLGKIAMARGDMAGAINLFSEALKRDPSSQEARAAIGGVLGGMPQSR